MAASRERVTDWPIERNNPKLVFDRRAEWNGISLRHARFLAGETPEHALTEHEIAMPLEGSFTAWLYSATGQRRVGFSTVGHTSILPAGQTTSARAEREIEYLSLFLSPTLFARVAEEAGLGGEVELMENCSASDPLIRQIGLALMRESESQQPAGRLYAESLGNVLAVHLLRHHSSRRPSELKSGGLAGHRLRRVREFIRENLSRDLGLTEIAEVADLSPFHFARAFKQTTGLTPHQYLTSARIEQAKELLAQSDMPIVEISFAAGFKNQSHFTTIFRRMTSMTPGAYRDIARRA
ncbi:MAG: AraC family transcriptional regulator [Acidobacteriota bacterium]